MRQLDFLLDVSNPTVALRQLLLLSCEDQTLLVWWNTFLILDLAALRSVIVLATFEYAPSSTTCQYSPDPCT